MHTELSEFFQANDRKFSRPIHEAKTPREVLTQSGLPYLPMDQIQVPYEEMLKEALALEKAAIPHRANKESHSGWKSLVLHGLSSVHTQGAEQYGFDPEDQSLYRWTDIADFAPVTKNFFQETFNYDSYQRVRFMYLEPGGYVLPHTDTDRYYLGPKNIALNNPEGCQFVMEGVGVLPFYPGRILKLALCHRHSVWNRSDQTRVHIIVHGSPNYDFWSTKYLESYQKIRSS